MKENTKGKIGNRCSNFLGQSLLQAVMVFTITNGIIVIMNSMQHIDKTEEAVHSNNLVREYTTERHLVDSHGMKNYRASLIRVEDHERPSDFPAETPNLYELIGSPVMNNEQITGKMMCDVEVEKKFVRRQFWYKAPSLADDQQHQRQQPRIPRIIHQFWVENITAATHPNLSRLQNSWRASGWEYRFYNNETASKYINDNFPKEIGEAYDALIPSVFKADLFRYCVLFLEGGIWADVEIQLQSYLNNVATGDTSLIIPRELNGNGLGTSLIMSAPGHPVMAEAIETATNSIRNRFNIVDITGRYCPEVVNFKLLQSHPEAFLTGNGMLGYAMKKVSNYPLGVPFQAGPFGMESIVTEGVFPEGYEQKWHKIIKETFQNNPYETNWKTTILRRLRGDMGATRFTDIKRNMIIASTGYTLAREGAGFDYYDGDTLQEGIVWGIKNVYKDLVSKNEDIKISLVSDDKDD